MSFRRPGVGVGRRTGFRGVGGGAPYNPLLNLGPLGPATFARASAAWRASDDDLIVTPYASGELRRYYQDGHWWNVLESAVENLTGADPTDIDDAGDYTLIGSASLDTGVLTAPDGASTYSRLTFTAAASDGIGSDSGTAPAGGALVRVSFWAVTESGTHPVRVGYEDGGGQQVSADKTVTTTPQRLTATFTADGSPTGCSGRVINGSGGSAGAVLIWGIDAQEDAPNLLPAPVLAASATKAADDLSVANASVPADLLGVGCWFKYKPYHNDTQWSAYNINGRFLNFDNNNYLAINNGTGTFSLESDNTNVGSSAKTWSARQELTIVVDFVADEVRFGGFTTGDETLDISSAGDWTADVTTQDLQVGDRAALARSIWGEITDLYPLATAPI